ncbi:MAG TPA: phage holin family protein [Rubrivivax sp.]|jgi:uncharacterized membrane protein YqjE|nr:phage holin family protein [Rubrivivax sp.]
MNEAVPQQGLFASLKRLLATLLEIAHVRLELVLNELDQQKLQLFDALLIAAASLLALGLGLALLIAFVVSLFAEPHRPIVLGVLMVLFVGGSVWGLLAARARLRAGGRSLEASLAELRRDATDLTRRR